MTLSQFFATFQIDGRLDVRVIGNCSNLVLCTGFAQVIAMHVRKGTHPAEERVLKVGSSLCFDGAPCLDIYVDESYYPTPTRAKREEMNELELVMG